MENSSSSSKLIFSLILTVVLLSPRALGQSCTSTAECEKKHYSCREGKPACQQGQCTCLLSKAVVP
ncbi:hypothetical protein CRG98_032725 [Punica granatum]|uniref:Uncharacterized protein n=1 Tax=Punica granatum TaxID=22663 RepID=A0A2I0ISF5_PUNGR|nr:hypothetical protein CRG98_032725 [Punica granatum]